MARHVLREHHIGVDGAEEAMDGGGGVGVG